MALVRERMWSIWLFFRWLLNLSGFALVVNGCVRPLGLYVGSGGEDFTTWESFAIGGGVLVVVAVAHSWMARTVAPKDDVALEG